ncbi:MAG: serine hydroxymethyltransferase [Patescibacteria group bacterium]
MFMYNLQNFDHEIADAIKNEIARQKRGLEMIASENIVSEAVLEALGTPLTNKYSEGYPGKRYYSGNEFIDVIENLAIERAKKLFNAEHANVQPHSGSGANMAAYMAVLNPGDKILAMNLAHGGHLTHGSPVNFSGKLYQIIPYGVRQDTEIIDMDEVAEIARREHPRLIVAGYTAYSRHLDFARFREIADEVGAYLMVDMAHFAGLVAARVHPDPIPYADIVTTTTHKTLRGPRGAMILCKVEDRLDPGGKKNLAQKIDSAVFPGIQGGPLDHCIAAKAVALKEAMRPDFVEYQKQVLLNAKALAETLVAEGIRVITGGTDNHLALVDLTGIGLSGKEGETLLDSVGIYTNKNMIPFDTRKPLDPSGLRIGAPALTTRGLKEDDLRAVGRTIADVLKNRDDDSKSAAKNLVQDLTDKYPIYQTL